LTDSEWDTLRSILEPPAKNRGRPRNDNYRNAAELGLFRLYHSQSPRYRAFGWHELSEEDFGIPVTTANQRYLQWIASGAWVDFWAGLLNLRRATVVPRHQKVPPSASGSPVIGILQELENAYHFFNYELFGGELPEKMVLLLDSPRKNYAGFYCARVWRPLDREEEPPLGQITVCSSVLGEGVEAVLEVLLHEMVHARNLHLGIEDTDPKTQYHNRHFRDVCLIAGLSCGTRHLQRGYAATSLNARALQAIRAFKPRSMLSEWMVGLQQQGGTYLKPGWK